MYSWPWNLYFVGMLFVFFTLVSTQITPTQIWRLMLVFACSSAMGIAFGLSTSLLFKRAKVLQKEILKPVVLLLGCNYACDLLAHTHTHTKTWANKWVVHQNPRYLLCIELILLSYRDYQKPWSGSPWTNQYNGMSFAVAQMAVVCW